MGDPPKPRTWRESLQQSADQRPHSRQRKALLVAASMLALAGVLAAFFLYPRAAPRPYFVAIVIDQYRETDRHGNLRFPVSAWSAQDREALGALGWAGHGTFTSQLHDLLLRELTSLRESRSADQPLVLYLSAYATTRDDGVVCLLPADARLDDPTTWLPFRDILDLIQACPSRHKLLLLDVMKPLTDARAGLLSTEVAEPLRPLLEGLKEEKGLHVLCACSPGQVSLASEELGHSAFVYYLLEGLAGKADGQLEGKKPDGLVSVKELAAYVRRQVQTWAWLTQAASQTPVLYGPENDFSLTLVEKDRLVEPDPLEKEYPKFLSKGWERRDAWRSDVLRPVPADLLCQMDATLLRAEERWRGGVEAGEVERALAERLTTLERHRQRQSGTVSTTAPRSLAEALRQGAKPPEEGLPEARRQLKELALLYQQVQVPKPNEKDAAKLKEDTEALRKKFADKPFDLAWTIFRVAVEEDALAQATLRCWYELLRPLPPYAEVRFLQRLLTDLKIDKPENWPAEAVSAALRVTELAEQVEANKGPFRTWVADLDTKAARERQTGEELLFAKETAARSRAVGVLNEARQDYAMLNAYLTTLHGAQRSLWEAQIELPGSVRYLERQPDQEASWLLALRETRTVQDMLAQPPPAGKLEETVRLLGEHASVLRNGLNTLRQPIEPDRLRRWIAQRSQATAADFLQTGALLLQPRLSARERADLWKAYRSITASLQEEAGTRSVATNVPGFDASKALRQEREQALLRARLSAGLLRLTGAAEANKVELAVQTTATAPSELGAWKALRQALRQAWKSQEAEQLKRETN
jgi:hypothetical protein